MKKTLEVSTPHKASMLAIAAAIAACLCLTSCINSVKLSDQAIVQAVGIDMDDDKIKLTMQIFAPSGGGDGKIGATADNAKIIEASGTTITEAMQNATLTQGKKMFSGHNRIILIGEDFAQQGIGQLLEYFSANAFARKNVNLAIARGKAGDIVKTKLNQGMVPANILQQLIINANDIGFADDVMLYEFERSMQNNYDCDILPIIQQQPQAQKEAETQPAQGMDKGGGDEKKEDFIEPISTLEVDGSAIIVDGKMQDTLTEQETRGALWLRDQVQSSAVITSTDVYSLACVIVSKTRTKITPEIAGNDMLFKVKVTCDGTIGELHIADGKAPTTTDIKGIQKAAASVIEEECKIAFERAIKQNKADIFNLGDIVWANDVESWRLVRDNWAEHSDSLRIEVEATVDVDSVGLEFTENKHS